MQQGELSSVIYTNLPVGSYTFHLAVLAKIRAYR